MKPHIVIDARLYGPKHTGLGRYTKNLLVALKNHPDFSKNKYTLLVYPELYQEISHDLKDSYQYVITPLRHYSVSEQIFLPILLSRLKPTLVHFTHLDKPILYTGKSVVTIHDLIRHFSKGSETTTHLPILYWPKYWGYLLMTWFIIKFNHIIVPSNFWHEYIINKYNINPQKIVTTYEAVDPSIRIINSKLIRNFKLKIKNYIIYTGNLYPHKNITVVFQALQKLPNLKLKIICARSYFQNSATKLANRLKIASQIEFLGYVDDNNLYKIYSHALALVHPALLEGFSLTGLEAMALSCPVIAANSSCLPEIYQDSVLYFDPFNSDDLVQQITTLQKNPHLRQSLIKLGHTQVKKYSWDKTASQTLTFYSHIINEN
jgi:glycosyltransferase involved in cell wall biosynthesis